MTKVLIIGSEGVVGRILRPAFPDCITLDLSGNADVKVNLLSYPELPNCDVIVMLACSTKNPEDPFEKQQKSLRMAEFVVLYSISKDIPIVWASSVWAEIHPLNAYGTVKRCVEQMVDSHGGRSIRLGWVGSTAETLEVADDFLKSVVWSDDRVISEFERAVEAVSKTPIQNSVELKEACKNVINVWRTTG